MFMNNNIMYTTVAAFARGFGMQCSAMQCNKDRQVTNKIN